MKCRTILVCCLGLLFTLAGSANAASKSTKGMYCNGVDPKDDAPLQAGWTEPLNGECHPGTSNGYPIPDPKCTPGAYNTTLGVSVLGHKGFKTGCVRDKATSAKQKDKVYGWYGIKKPANNTGSKQVCEKDHLVSLEIGGADTLDNIWPQCGPSRVVLKNRYFKQKDLVENFVAVPFHTGENKLVLDDGTELSLADVQHQIAKDWTYFLPYAQRYYGTHKKAQNGG